MDKAALIRHEIEKRRDHNLAIGNPLFAAMAEEDIELLSFIDSMQEEPVSEDNNLRKASEEYLKVLSETPYNNTPITNAQIIVRELITFLDNPSKYNPNHIEEPVSEELGEAADKYVENWYKEHEMEVKDYPIDIKISKEDFIAGANWQKQQMMKDAVETIIDSKPNDYGEFIPIVHVKVGSSYKYGEKVRIIIIKEG